MKYLKKKHAHFCYPYILPYHNKLSCYRGDEMTARDMTRRKKKKIETQKQNKTKNAQRSYPLRLGCRFERLPPRVIVSLLFNSHHLVQIAEDAVQHLEEEPVAVVGARG